MKLNGRRRKLKAWTTTRPHNLRFGLVISVVRTVQADVDPDESPIYALDLQFGCWAGCVTWS